MSEGEIGKAYADPGGLLYDLSMLERIVEELPELAESYRNRVRFIDPRNLIFVKELLIENGRTILPIYKERIRKIRHDLDVCMKSPCEFLSEAEDQSRYLDEELRASYSLYGGHYVPRSVVGGWVFDFNEGRWRQI